MTQKKRPSGKKNSGTTETTCVSMTRRTSTDASPSFTARYSGRVSRGSPAKTVSNTDSVISCVKRGAFSVKDEREMTNSSEDNTMSLTSKAVETHRHQHAPTACPLPQVEVDSPKTTKKKSAHKVSVSHPPSVSGQRKVTGSSRQNMPSGERRRAWGSGSERKTTVRRSTAGRYNAKMEVSSLSERESVSQLSHSSTPSSSSQAGYTNWRLSGSRQGGINLTHWSKSSHIQLPSALIMPQRNFARSRASKCWSQGKRKVQLEDIAAGLGRMHYRNIIVMSGAGISTASGIPDFR